MSRLSEFLRSATLAEREQCALLAGTSVGYLYQLGGGHRINPGIALAVGIESATRKLHVKTRGRLPLVTITDLLAVSTTNKEKGHRR